MKNESLTVFLICCTIAALLVYFAIEGWLAANPSCPDCGRRRRKSAHVCPHCGYRFEPRPEGASR